MTGPATRRPTICKADPTLEDDCTWPGCLCARTHGAAHSGGETGEEEPACLDGAPTADLETGDPVTGPIPTSRYNETGAS